MKKSILILAAIFAVSVNGSAQKIGTVDAQVTTQVPEGRTSPSDVEFFLKKEGVYQWYLGEQIALDISSDVVKQKGDLFHIAISGGYKGELRRCSNFEYKGKIVERGVSYYTYSNAWVNEWAKKSNPRLGVFVIEILQSLVPLEKTYQNLNEGLSISPIFYTKFTSRFFEGGHSSDKWIFTSTITSDSKKHVAVEKPVEKTPIKEKVVDKRIGIHKLEVASHTHEPEFIGKSHNNVLNKLNFSSSTYSFKEIYQGRVFLVSSDHRNKYLEFDYDGICISEHTRICDLTETNVYLDKSIKVYTDNERQLALTLKDVMDREIFYSVNKDDTYDKGWYEVEFRIQREPSLDNVVVGRTFTGETFEEEAVPKWLFNSWSKDRQERFVGEFDNSKKKKLTKDAKLLFEEKNTIEKDLIRQYFTYTRDWGIEYIKSLQNEQK